MTAENQICANCGHEEKYHSTLGCKKGKYISSALGQNIKFPCPCKKFVAQTRQTKLLKAQIKLGNNPYGEDISNKDKTAGKNNQTQDTLTKLWDNKEDKRWNNQDRKGYGEIGMYGNLFMPKWKEKDIVFIPDEFESINEVRAFIEGFKSCHARMQEKKI